LAEKSFRTISARRVFPPDVLRAFGNRHFEGKPQGRWLRQASRIVRPITMHATRAFLHGGTIPKALGRLPMHDEPRWAQYDFLVAHLAVTAQTIQFGRRFPSPLRDSEWIQLGFRRRTNCRRGSRPTVRKPPKRPFIKTSSSFAGDKSSDKTEFISGGNPRVHVNTWSSKGWSNSQVEGTRMAARLAPGHTSSRTQKPERVKFLQPSQPSGPRHPEVSRTTPAGAEGQTNWPSEANTDMKTLSTTSLPSELSP